MKGGFGCECGEEEIPRKWGKFEGFIQLFGERENVVDEELDLY